MSYKFKFTISNNILYYKTAVYDGDIKTSDTEYEILNTNIKSKYTLDDTFNVVRDVNEFVVLPYNNTESSVTWENNDGIYRPTGQSKVSLHYKITQKTNFNTTTDFVEYVDDVTLNNCTFKRLSNGLGLYENGTNAQFGWLNGNGKLTNNIGLLTIIKDPTDNTKYRLLQFYGTDTTGEIWKEFKFIATAEYGQNPEWNKSWTDNYSEDLFEITLEQAFEQLTEYPDTTNDSVSYMDNLYSYDVDNNGLLIDNLKEIGSSVYYTNSKLRNNGLYTLCDELPIYDLSDGVKTSSSNTIYVLFRVSKTANGYEYDALYSPELFEATGIGYILSNWVWYNENNELEIRWWPELSPNKFVDNPPYSIDNPLIGKVKCWKDASFLKYDDFEKDVDGTTRVLADNKFYPNVQQYYNSVIAVSDKYIGTILNTEVYLKQIELEGFEVGTWFDIRVIGDYSEDADLIYYTDNLLPPEDWHQDPREYYTINHDIRGLYTGEKFYWNGHNLIQLVSESQTKTEDHAYINEQIKTFYVDDKGFRHDVPINVEFRDNEKICLLPKRETNVGTLDAKTSLKTYIDTSKIDITDGQDKIALFGYSRFLPIEAGKYVINDKDSIQNLVMWKDVKGQEQLNLIDGINYYNNNEINLFPIRNDNDEQIVRYIRLTSYNVISTKWKTYQNSGSQVYNETREETIEYDTSIHVISDASEVDVDYIRENTRNGLITPMDYYAFNNNTTFGGYAKIETETEKQNWFWVEDFKNWCIWRYDESQNMYYLSMWNGYNGWDDFREIYQLISGNTKDYFYLAYRYFYPKYVFNIGTQYDYEGGYRIPEDRSRVVNDTKKNIYHWSLTDENNAVLTYNTLILNKTSNYSTYDPYTFQNIRNSNYIADTFRLAVIPGTKVTRFYDNGVMSVVDVDNGEKDTDKVVNPFTTNGVPCIIRTSSGQLNLMFAFKFDYEYSDITNILLNDIDDLNNTCINFFGNGNSKTMDDWKNFKFGKNEEIETTIVGIDSETIYNRPNQVNSVADTINMNIKFSVPRPNVITKTTTDDDYAIRWNR